MRAGAACAWAAVCILLLAGRTSAACIQGTTGKSPNCKDCPAGTTTAGPGDNRPCNLCDVGYGGKFPNCKRCSTDFLSTTTRLKDGTNKCVCIEGYTGTAPNCKACPAATNTEGNGNKLPCKCVQRKGEFFDRQVNCATCNNANGWRRPLVSGFWPAALKPVPRNICVRCAMSSEGAVNTTLRSDPTPYCGCDRSKKYAFTGQWDGPYSFSPFCIKCTGKNQVIDSRGRCVCKKGFGISRSVFGGDDYCMPCGGKASSKDSRGFCICKKGYAFEAEGGSCIPCGKGGFVVNKKGYCECKKGFFGQTLFSDFIKPSCKKCAAGQSSEIRGGSPRSVCYCKDPGAAVKDPGAYEKGCFCRWGFKPKSKGSTTCVFDKYCKAGQYIIQFWSGRALPKGWNKRGFPLSVLAKKPTAVRRVTAKGLTWTGTAATLPKGVDAKLYVARIRRCLCVFHDDFSSRFNFFFKVKGGAGARVEIDGGRDKEDDCKGEYYDQNACLRPLINVLTPNGTATARGTTVVFPLYQDRQGGFLSGYDYILEATKYKACHNVTVLLWNTKRGGSLQIKLPKSLN